MRLALLTVVIASAFGLLSASCGAARTCTPQSCTTGCCDDSGECRTGGENSACGASGNACVNCAATAQVCGNQACVAATTGGGGGATGGGAGGGGGSTGGGAGGGGMEFCTRQPVACSDQAIAGLDLKSNLATGGITNVADGTGWLSTIDSRGGGFTPTESYVYARFTDTGLAVVPLSDMTALDSMDWDIAFRRFVMRINSGDSGPACVTAAMLPSGTTYESVTSLPSGLIFESDDFLTDPPACTFIDDGSGLTTSPRTYLSTFYQYTSCVTMTDQVFVVRAGNMRHAKFQVKTYYATQAGQDACNSSGSSGGVAGGTVRVKWSWLD